ncbi:MAG: 3-hydroxyanthranilic acid dioxygenase [Alyxoria varia]|nr:MAG: 3-hydroxyanthranilic acid dioxygenase [Alyxoria varia]
MSPPAMRALPKAMSPIIRQTYPRATTATAKSIPASARSFTYSSTSARRPNISSTPRHAQPKRLQSNAAFERPPEPNIESVSKERKPAEDPIVKTTTSSPSTINPTDPTSSSPATATPHPAVTSPDLTSPLHLPTWLETNSHLLKPPIGNHCVTNSSMTTMIVGGPNARTDYHINSTPEFFYQYKGDMVLKTVETEPAASTQAGFENTTTATDTSSPGNAGSKEVFRDIRITEGSLYLLPPNVPHSPQRFADTVGVVVELPRPAGARDTLRWYCQECKSKVHEESFECVDLGSQIKRAVHRFENDLELRRCGNCGATADVRPK